jgi:NADPH-dependent 2,4-dienoyl-CoA reductase/sulfur reductase-like enzyme
MSACAPEAGAPRVLIVGAGPAGIRCAEALAAAGLRPAVIDEGRRDGGQIYRRQPEGFTRSYRTLYGTEARRAEAIHRCFDGLRGRIDYLPETLAWNVVPSTLHVLRHGRQLELPYDALVLCTGATDRLMPVKGWELAGVFSLGGAQVALKSQACAIGKAVVFLGTGPLLYLVAAQYAKAGAHVAAVLDTSPALARLAALPRLLAAPGTLMKGMRLTFALRRAGIAVHTGIRPVEILGSAREGVRGVTVKDARDRTLTFDCDAVALGAHLRPETQLADLARCEFHFDTGFRQWVPRSDAAGRSSVPRVYLAGDGAGVLGAAAAEVSGRAAAMAVLEDLGRAAPARDREALRRRHARLRRFARGLSTAFPWPAQHAARLCDDTVVCRCECITAGELRQIVRETEARELNRAKAFSRVGMGRCQGRYCGHAAAEIIAHAAGIPLEQVGRLRAQAPVKPLPIASAAEEP